MKKNNGERIFSVFNVIIMIFLCLITLYPFWYTVCKSLSTNNAAMSDIYFLYPKEISFEAYKRVFASPQLYVSYGVTILRTVIGTVLSIIFLAMYAYPLSKKYMPHRKLYMKLTIFTMIFSGGLIPSYVLMKNLHLLNNFWVYILPLIISAYNVIIFKSFFMSIPESLSESAKIDGANEFIILFRIIMPLSKAVIATVALWCAVTHWNSWFDGMLYVDDKKLQILQMYLRQIVQENNFSDIAGAGMSASEQQSSQVGITIQSATIVVSMLPVLIAYPFVQKYFVNGVMLGSVKG